MFDLEYLELAWTEFTSNEVIVPGVDAIIARSWQRSRPLLNPFQKVNLKHLGVNHIRSALISNTPLLSIARPIMEDIYQYIENSQTVIALINGAGYIMDLCGDQDMIDLARSFSIESGTLVAESHMGTNAFGIPLFEGVPVRTVGPEHYLKQFHPLAMTAAPIYSLSGRLIGNLGTLSLVDNYHPHSLGLVVAGVRAIEGQLESTSLLEEKNSHLTELNMILASLTEGIVVCDHHGIVMHANPKASKILNLPQAILVGRPIHDYLSFPPAFENAFQYFMPIRDMEINLATRDETINCIVSTRYIQKENQPRWMIMVLRAAEEFRQAVTRQIGVQMPFTLADFPGDSPKIRQVRRIAKSAASAKASILLRGESGTGKNLFARAIHMEGNRQNKPFIIFSCASIPNEIILKELLGFEGHAHSMSGGRPSKFELGHTGTIFFQDVDQLPLEAQAALLTVVDLGILMRLGSSRPVSVDVRVITSTSANLEQMIAEGNFRADLYYRLSSFEITLPPLRERSQDIPQLIEMIVGRLSKKPIQLAPGTIAALQKYSWPGNIRELEASLERAITQSRGSNTLNLLHFPRHIREPITSELLPEPPSEIKSIEDVERETLIQAARKCNGNVTLMANRLGISRSTVWRKLKALNLTAKQFRTAS